MRTQSNTVQVERSATDTTKKTEVMLEVGEVWAVLSFAIGQCPRTWAVFFCFPIQSVGSIKVFFFFS